MRSIWPLMQALPICIAFVALLGFAFQVTELWLTRQHIIGTGYGADGPSGTERVIFMSSFLRTSMDFFWNIGWAVVVFAAVRFTDNEGTS